MPYPGLSVSISHFVDTLIQILFEDMEPGGGLLVRALDARTKEEGEFSLRFLGFQENELRDTAIISLCSKSFSFYGSDRKTPVTLRPGTIVLSGTAQTHLPTPINCMIGTGGIHVARDFSFESVNGGVERVYVERVTWLTHISAAPSWTMPTWALQNFFARLEATEKRLEQKLTVKTISGTTYSLSETDADGFRTLTSDRDDTPVQGKIPRIIPGFCMYFIPKKVEDRHLGFQSSMVAEISFGSDG